MSNANEPANPGLTQIGFMRWHPVHGFRPDLCNSAWYDVCKIGWTSVLVYADLYAALAKLSEPTT